MNDSLLYPFYASLTNRQQHVLQLAATELSNKEIGQRLKMKSSVVAWHLTTIYAELSNQAGFEKNYPTRYTVILVFAPFFERHPELRKIV